MYKVLTQPVVIHAKETVVIAKSDEEALCSFERILMCTFGAIQKNGNWRRYR
jgi:hypothetical protein